jgi:hypothetical protein
MRGTRLAAVHRIFLSLCLRASVRKLRGRHVQKNGLASGGRVNNLAILLADQLVRICDILFQIFQGLTLTEDTRDLLELTNEPSLVFPEF